MVRSFFFVVFIFLQGIEAKPIVLIFSHNATPNSPKGQAAIYFKKHLEKITDKKILVKIYSNSKLYSDSKVLKALKVKKIHIASPSFINFLDDIPELTIFELPFLFKNTEHVHLAYNSKIGESIKRSAAANGYQVLNFWDKGFKQLTTGRAYPIKFPKQLKNQTIRIRPLKVLNLTYETLGAKPIVLPYNKLNSYLKSKKIDAQENTIVQISKKGFYKYQNFMTLTNHGYLGYMVVMNSDFWKTLPSFAKEAITKTMNEATIRQRHYTKLLEEKHFKKLQKYAFDTDKLKIIKNLADGHRTGWKNAVKPVYKDFYTHFTVGRNLIEEARLLEDKLKE